MRKFIFFILVCALNCACSLTKSPEIPDFDAKIFKKDKLGCGNQRKGFIKILETNKEKLLGISENEIYYYLGKYDYQGIDPKNEKVFVYFLEAGAQCNNLRNRTNAKSMTLKFNAVSLVKEVIIQEGGYE